MEWFILILIIGGCVSLLPDVSYRKQDHHIGVEGKAQEEVCLWNGRPFDINLEEPWLQEDGILKVFHNGSLNWEASYVGGQKHGVQRQYRPDGSLEWETHFKNGREYGAANTWDLQGFRDFNEQWDHYEGAAKDFLSQ